MERVIQQPEVQGSSTPEGRRGTASGRRPTASGDMVATVVASVAIALPLVFYLHQHVEILRLGYEIESLKERRVEFAERSRELRAERTQQASLGRVEAQARLMGLEAPPASAIYIARSPASSREESLPVASKNDGQSVVAKLE